jgi:hypothetical protein
MKTELPRTMLMGTAIPKSIYTVLNQLYQIEQKLAKLEDCDSLRRNIEKMKDAFAEEGIPIYATAGSPSTVSLTYENPMGQRFNDTRTDLDATIAGRGTDNLVVVEVIRPIIRATMKGGEAGSSRIVQNGIVIVESRGTKEA